MGRSPAIVERVKRHDADVVTLLDSHWYGNTVNGPDQELVEDAKAAFVSQGYEAFEVEYGDFMEGIESMQLDRPARLGRHLMVLSRLPVVDFKRLRLKFRNAAEMHVKDETGEVIQLFSIHHDDRPINAEQHVANALLDRMDTDLPIAVAGDFNSMHRGDALSKFLRRQRIRQAIKSIPGGCFVPQSQALRVARMGEGRLVKVLEDAGLRDVDPKHQRTFPDRLPVLALDRCMVNNRLRAVGPVTVGPRTNSSDHRAISVTLAA